MSIINRIMDFLVEYRCPQCDDATIPWSRSEEWPWVHTTDGRGYRICLDCWRRLYAPYSVSAGKEGRKNNE